ncbi:MAG TPA: alpha-galactosidase [Edaphobacter sp.]|nr:alpha-galactosidase [Edaphobacter sp.]
MNLNISICTLLIFYGTSVPWSQGETQKVTAISSPNTIQGSGLSIETFNDGSYALRSQAISGVVLRSGVEVDIDGSTLKSSEFPRHLSLIAPFSDQLGAGRILTVTHTGLPTMPDLVSVLRVYDDRPWGDLQVSVHNTTSRPIEVHAIRVIRSDIGRVLNLNGADEQNRVLSDSFSEDTPQLRLMDLTEPSDGMHRAFGSQLIYNRQSGLSLFLGALSADKLLTVFHLKSSGRGSTARVLSYDVTATGTNEILPSDAEHRYSTANNVALSLSLLTGESLSSERLMFAIGSRYHEQLENYGHAIRVLHKALVTTPTPIGWWSWTAYYYGVTQDTVLTNATWLAQNLEALGYRYFQIDEGYQYARGEYATADGKAFPNGMGVVGDAVRKHGLTFGVWVAPFEVSERSWVYEHHQDWLVHNKEGKPIHIGKIGNFDELYVLDTTNPAAQDYLRYTYRTLVNEWGVHFIKMDFMDVAAVEGVFYRPNTTALEALRIGLETIRSAVGDDVVLDKDGSPMLTPVGIVNAGRTSQDTGHTFESTRDAASGVAARYYMNRNFFITDPDAFTVSKQTVPDRGWHGNKLPLTMDEAETSIALSAVSGGMFEIGDDLPTLGVSPERLELVRNQDLLDMARLGRASVPLDLMTYPAEDRQPSIFFLNEDARQKVLTIFNWTENVRSHTVALSDLGMKSSSYTVTDVLHGRTLPIQNGIIEVVQPPHSVRILKLADSSIPETPLTYTANAPASAKAGEGVDFSISGGDEGLPVLLYQWSFGDGTSAEGEKVLHAYTLAGNYIATVTAIGLNGRTQQHTLRVSVTGFVPTLYNPSAKERYGAPR